MFFETAYGGLCDVDWRALGFASKAAYKQAQRGGPQAPGVKQPGGVTSHGQPVTPGDPNLIPVPGGALPQGPSGEVQGSIGIQPSMEATGGGAGFSLGSVPIWVWLIGAFFLLKK